MYRLRQWRQWIGMGGDKLLGRVGVDPRSGPAERVTRRKREIFAQRHLPSLRPTRTTTNIPARLDRLPWSRWHVLLVLALGITWLLDGLKGNLAGSLAGILKSPEGLSFTDADLGLAGSLYLMGRSCLGAIIGLGVLVLRQHLPESPRWLMVHGRLGEAETTVDAIERKIGSPQGHRPTEHRTRGSAATLESDGFVRLGRSQARDALLHRPSVE